MKKYLILLIILIFSKLLIFPNSIFIESEDKSHLYNRGLANYYFQDIKMDLINDYYGMNFFNTDIFNIKTKKNGIYIYSLLNSHRMDNSLLKAVQGEEYQSYLFQVNKKKFSAFANFYTHDRYGDLYWEGKNYFFEYNTNNHSVQFYLSQNNKLPSEKEKYIMYSLFKYNYTIPDFSFSIKREYLEQNFLKQKNQLFKSKMDYKGYLFGSAILVNSDKYKIFLKKYGEMADFNYSIQPYYYDTLFDIDFNFNYNNWIYFEKKSNYDWIESNQNNYYEVGYNNNYINLYTRYIDKQLNYTVELEDEIVYGANYNIKFDISSNLHFLSSGDIFSNDFYNDIFKNSILFEEYFFQSDLKLTALVTYNYITRSIKLTGSNYYDAYLSADLKGGRFFIKIKNVLKDNIHHYERNKDKREIIFGFNLFLYN